jgi:Na+-transporting NADH:ubiquinone oxidoreductase subunit NqrE
MSFVFLASSFAMVYSFITAIGFFLNENDPNVGKLIMYGLRYGYAWTLALIPLAVFIVTPIILAPIPKHVDGTL